MKKVTVSFLVSDVDPDLLAGRVMASVNNEAGSVLDLGYSISDPSEDDIKLAHWFNEEADEM